MYAFSDVLDFLIHILITLYIYAFVIRMILGLSRADFYNPFSQFIVTVTRPVLQPLRKLIPSIGRLDTAALIVIIVLKFLELILRGAVAGKTFILSSLFVPVIFGLIDLVLNLFIIAIIILVIISWVAPHIHAQGNPLASILRSITEPLLRPARKIIPPIGVFDLSTLAVLIALYALQIFIKSLYY